MRVPLVFEVPCTQVVPEDVYPSGQVSTHVTFSKSFGDLQVRQLDAEVSQVSHVLAQAVQIPLLPKNPIPHVLTQVVPCKKNPV